MEAPDIRENCQVGVFLWYVTATGHTLIDRELYLPLDWIEDHQRCQAAGIPDSVRFQTKPELARGMVARLWEAQVPIAWVVADTVSGGNLDLRTWLETHQYPSVLAVPCNEPVGILIRDGQRRRVEVWEVEALLLGAQDWQRLSMSEGTKVFAPKGTTLPEMVAAIGARWHIEEDFENGKDLGLDHYEVRSFIGWYRHITLVLVALVFLTGICATERCSPSPPAPSPLPARPAVLGLTVPEVRHLLAQRVMALYFIGLSGSGLVVVASLPSKLCQLLPHQTSSEGWLILASSPFPPPDVCYPSFFLPDFQEISWKCRSSGKFRATLGSLVGRVVSARKETRS